MVREEGMHAQRSNGKVGERIVRACAARGNVHLSVEQVGHREAAARLAALDLLLDGGIVRVGLGAAPRHLEIAREHDEDVVARRVLVQTQRLLRVCQAQRE